MRLVIIESPYGRNPDGSIASARTIERNVTYLRACMADCLRRGEAPIASHALYTQPGVLDDGKVEERRKGMMAGWAWHAKADAVVRYIDLGVTSGMLDGIAHAHSVGTLIETRELGGRWSASYRRAQEDYTQDRYENAPFASIGGLAARTDPQRPKYIEPADWPTYLLGYVDAARTDLGDEWATCEFGWKPALTIGGEGR